MDKTERNASQCGVGVEGRRDLALMRRYELTTGSLKYSCKQGDADNTKHPIQLTLNSVKFE